MRFSFYPAIKSSFYILLSLLFWQCTTTDPCVYVKIKQPTNIDIVHYSKIAVGDILDDHELIIDHSQMISDDIISVLNNLGSHEVIDHTKLSQMLYENKLIPSPKIILDQAVRPKLKQVLDNAVYITVTANDDYKDNMIVTEPYKEEEETSKG